MALAERMNELVVYSQMGATKFSDFVGFKTPQTVREIISGRTKTLSDSVAYKLAKAFPNLNILWLGAGSGSMLIDASKPLDYNIPPLKDDTSAQHPESQLPSDGLSTSRLTTLLFKAMDEIAAQRRLAERAQSQVDKAQLQLDKALSQIEELVALAKSSLDRLSQPSPQG